MAFTIIQNGEPEDADVIMANFTNVNYGNPLRPVNSAGAAVDNTIDIGSSSHGFKDGFLTGKLTIGAQPYFLAGGGIATGNGNVTNLVQSINVGSFTLQDGKINIPVTGIYIVSVNCFMRGSYQSSTGHSGLYLQYYLSNNTLARSMPLCSGLNTDTAPQSGSSIVSVESGGYFYLLSSETIGYWTEITSIQISIMGWPSQ